VGVSPRSVVPETLRNPSADGLSNGVRPLQGRISLGAFPSVGSTHGYSRCSPPGSKGDTKNPPHPGDFIRTEIIEPAGLSVTAAAAALRVSRPTLPSLLNGKAGLSGNMALRIEKAFGVKMDTLLRIQASYDIAQARKRENQIHVRRIHLLAEIPA